jgi:hypothetical protein
MRAESAVEPTRSKTLEAGKVGNVLMTLAPALKKIRYSCAKKMWDAKQKQ